MLGSSAQANAELPPQNRLSGIVNNLAKRIFKGERITYDPELLASTATTLLTAMTTGYGKSLSDVDYDTPDFNTLRKLTENVFQFSASKDFHILQDMTLALKDTDGKLRSFSDFQKEVDKMNLQYNGNWLRTEYNHAVAASQCAARWTEQVSRSQSMPYLQYQAVMDNNTRPEHAALNGVIKRIDSDFWDKYYPPNGWGCRCEVIQLPGKNHKETPDMDLKHCKVAPMFQVNVGKKGVIFPKGHPYFMSQCQRCNGTPQSLALKPQCAACVEGRLLFQREVEKYEWKNFAPAPKYVINESKYEQLLKIYKSEVSLKDLQNTSFEKFDAVRLCRIISDSVNIITDKELEKAWNNTRRSIIKTKNDGIMLKILGDDFKLIICFDQDKKTVIHKYISINPSGTGMGSIISLELLKQYRTMGITKVYADPNLTSGGYTWARIGYYAKNRAEAEKIVLSRFDNKDVKDGMNIIDNFYQKGKKKDTEPFPMQKLGIKKYKPYLQGSNWNAVLNPQNYQCKGMLRYLKQKLKKIEINNK
ncbi:MAG: minor capsid protein [Bacteroidales bacterium]|nr:minor capsid protein [Bacteroidales bacterium]